MPPSPKIRLAWSLLTHDKMRFSLSVAGVAFAVVLIFAEIGFLNGVFDSQTLILKKFNADFFMVNSLKNGCYKLKPFPRVRLFQTLEVDGVEAAYPVYMDWMTLKNLRDKIQSKIYVLAFDTHDPSLLIPEVNTHIKELELPWTALADKTSKVTCFGKLNPGVTAELNGKKINIIGTCSLFSNFCADGHLVMSSTNLFKYFPSKILGQSRADLIEFGLIKMKEGADPALLQKELKQVIPEDVQILTKNEMIALTEKRWRDEKPVMQVFGLGMGIGFIIGIIICYQILFTEISDNRAEFATVKAIGYPDKYLVRVVMQEGLYLSLLAFFPGLLLSTLFYSILQNLSGIIMRMTPGRIAIVFTMTVLMCLVSALIAIRKVIRTDPAEVF